jgi:glycosyltransferase involved in cell wall biosynthesis
MRVLLSSQHRYPAAYQVGSGLAPRPRPSNACGMVHDLIARGLAELGHTVYYALDGGHDEALPPGVCYVDPRGPLPAVDVHHKDAYHEDSLPSPSTVPWVRTWHGYYGDHYKQPGPHDIFVSHALARAYGFEPALQRVVQRVVHNGLDPAPYRFSAQKSDYALFLAGMQGPDHQPANYLYKGLPTALSLCRETGTPLIVAGTAEEPEIIAEVARLCRAQGAEYVGDVRGEQKAALLADARALLFPTQVIEGFGLVIVEALLSGTPVIASNLGACVELIPEQVGFVCASRADYLDAFARVGRIDPHACRSLALERYDYRRMAAQYAGEYEREISD